MAERNFFRQSWIETVIQFADSDATSATQEQQWQIVKRLDQKYSQSDQEEWTDLGHPPCIAIALFRCVNSNSGESAFMKIYMQIPYQGSEFDLPEERRQQALPNETITEHVALLTLTKMKCQSSPTLLAWKREKQDDGGPVPGGFLVYLVTKKIPGERLDCAAFWKLSRGERDEIRQSFKAAWLDCLACGIRNSNASMSNLLWDQASKKIFIIDFVYDCFSTPTDAWRDSLWLSWGFARRRRVAPSFGEETILQDGNIDEKYWEL